MDTSTADGICRVTVLTPGGRTDLALPSDVVLADLYPEILRRTGQRGPAGAPPGWLLLRRDGSALDGSRTLAAQRVLDGELLRLRPFAEALPPVVHDDVAEAIAAAATGGHRWAADPRRAAGLAGGGLLLVLLALVLWYADPVRHDMHGLPGILAGIAGTVTAGVAAVRARVHGDVPTATASGIAALPLLLVAGSGLVGAGAGQGPGRLQLLLGCVIVLVASALLAVLVRPGDAPFVAAALASGTGILASFAAVLTQAAPASVAAVCAVAAIGAMAFLPALTARLVRLPTGQPVPGGRDEPVDGARIAATVRRGHHVLLGLLGGCAATVLACGAALGFAHSGWARTLALACGLAALLRSRIHRRPEQRACLAAAGAGTVVLLLLGLALDPATGGVQSELRTVWLAAGVAAGAALVFGLSLPGRRHGRAAPLLLGRLLDLAEGVVLLSLLPLCLAVLGGYAAVRSLTGG